MRRLFGWSAFIVVSLLPAYLLAAPAKDASVFRFHLAKEPSSVDPHLEPNAASGYAIQNLFRNLMRFRDDEGLLPDLAESCKRNKKDSLVCVLKKDLKWSDGSDIVANDFIQSYRRILDPNEKAPRADLLFSIKNAEAIYKKQIDAKDLGVVAVDARTLRFEFEQTDSEFEYTLVNVLTAPIKNKTFAAANAASLVTSGPYKISAWKPGERIRLTTNPHYQNGKDKDRPDVEVLFIPEDSVALQIYEKDGLSFLRRLPTLYIPQFKTRADFHSIPVTRFDHIGFGPALKDYPALREALVYSLNYKELQKLFSSEGVPGCPGIPKTWTDKELCYKLNLPRAKAAAAKVSKAPALTMAYSILGGEDHRRLAEWLQSQWQTNVGLSVQTMSRDNKLFLAELAKQPPAIFRKGATPDRPTCLAALSTFAADSPDNFIKLNDPVYEAILKELSEVRSEKKRRKLCQKGIQFLLDQHVFIPTGRFDFSMLFKNNFSGWNINTLNQLDLASLKAHK